MSKTDRTPLPIHISIAAYLSAYGVYPCPDHGAYSCRALSNGDLI